MAFQFGDILHASRLAWDLYNFGFHEQLKASRQYNEFLEDIKSLSTNLHSICRVAENAARQLHIRNSARPEALWDLTSLREIVGDYNQTIRDCEKLLKDNQRYNNASGPIHSLKWNALVQPDVVHLRSRISLHNSKILLLLKPLEIDLLLRVHQDLADRVSDMHHDLRLLMGIIIPGNDVRKEIEQQEEPDPFSVQVPADLSLKFQQAAEVLHPELVADGKDFPLAETARAFVLHFRESTATFNPDRFQFAEQRTASATAYLNLLKCVWLMQQLRRGKSFEASGSLSHWPSYIRGLDKELSRECWRFSSECPDQIYAPDLSGMDFDLSAFNIWPGTRRPSNLPSRHDRTREMREIVNLPLESRSPSATSCLRFLQVLDGSSSEYRLIVTAEERLANNQVQIEGAEYPDLSSYDEHDLIDAGAEQINDINLESACLIPLYAMPPFNGDSNEVILRTPNMETTYSFSTMRNLLRFQQAFTGFKPFRFYSQKDIQVAFVVTNKAPIVEDAVVQFWIPKRLQGQQQQPVNERQSTDQNPRPERSETLPDVSSPRAIPSDVPPTFTYDTNPTASSRFMSTSGPTTTHLLGKLSFESLSSRPTSLLSLPSSWASSGQERSSSVSPSRDRRQTTTSITGRVSEKTVKAVDSGRNSGFLHEKPVRPMLVIFSRGRTGSRELSITSVRIDDETAVNPERCDCRKTGSCVTAAIERLAGRSDLKAQRYVAGTGPGGFDLGKLGVTRRKEFPDSEFAKLKRISLAFKDSNVRQSFGGVTCRCKVITQGELNACIDAGHQGIFGEVKETGRRELRAYNRATGARQEIVIGRAPSETTNESGVS